MSKNRLFPIISLVFLFLLSLNGFAKDKIIKNEISSEGKKRIYYLCLPKSAESKKSFPLMILLHGSGRDGKILIEHWQKLADKEGIILVGPDSKNSAAWSIPVDGPKFIFDLVEELKSKHPIDSRRVYLFGHSAGAAFGLLLSLLESDYFAATAVSAGALQQKNYRFFEQADRKIPIALFVWDRDPLFPVDFVRQTRDAFAERKFVVELTEIPNLTHNYYSRSDEINERVWGGSKKSART